MFFETSFNYLLLQKCLGIVRRHDSRRSYAKICRKSVRINATFETIFRSFEKRKRRTVNKRVRFISHLFYLLTYYFWVFFPLPTNSYSNIDFMGQNTGS